MVGGKAILLNGWKGPPSAAKLSLKENSLLDLVGLETLLKQLILPSVNIF